MLSSLTCVATHQLADFGLGRRSGHGREQLTPTVVTLWCAACTRARSGKKPRNTGIAHPSYYWERLGLSK
jgi:hypothetical protein